MCCHIQARRRCGPENPSVKCRQWRTMSQSTQSGQTEGRTRHKLRGYWQAALTECSHSIAESGDRGMALAGHIMGNIQMKLRRLDRSEIPKGRTSSTGASWTHRPPPAPVRERCAGERKTTTKGTQQEHEESAGEQHGMVRSARCRSHGHRRGSSPVHRGQAGRQRGCKV